jgi:hypothetical protein
VGSKKRGSKRREEDEWKGKKSGKRIDKVNSWKRGSGLEKKCVEREKNRRRERRKLEKLKITRRIVLER